MAHVADLLLSERYLPWVKSDALLSTTVEHFSQVSVMIFECFLISVSCSEHQDFVCYSLLPWLAFKCNIDLKQDGKQSTDLRVDSYLVSATTKRKMKLIQET